MSTVATTTPTPAPTKLWPLYRAFVGFGMLAAGLVAVAWQLTAPRIAANRLALLESQVSQVVPGAVTIGGYLFSEAEPGSSTPAGFSQASAGDAEVWAGFAADQTLLGIAFESSAIGYQDQVRILLGYAPARGELLGVRVLESRETPGLGDRVGTDPTFLEEWVGRAMPLNEKGMLVHELVVVGRDGPHEAWTVDGITGATISSRAVVTAVNLGAATWLPRLLAHQDDFTVPEVTP